MQGGARPLQRDELKDLYLEVIGFDRVCIALSRRFFNGTSLLFPGAIEDLAFLRDNVLRLVDRYNERNPRSRLKQRSLADQAQKRADLLGIELEATARAETHAELGDHGAALRIVRDHFGSARPNRGSAV